MVREKNFNKLKQLDRIEYLLRLKGLDEKYELVTFFIGKAMLFLLGFMCLTLICFYSAFGLESFVNLLYSFKRGVKIMIIILVVFIIVDITTLFRRSTKVRKLNEEFFKIEVRNK